MNKKILLSLFLILSGFTGYSQTAPNNITLLGQVNTPSELSDVWGYASGGNEYAICGIQSGGVGIYNVTNPASASLIQTIPGVPSLWRDIKTWQNYAYVVNDDGGSGGIGLLVIDLTNLPSTVTYKDTIINGMTVAHNIWVDENGYLYAVGADNNQGVNIYDLSNPWYPNQVGAYTQNYVHDLYVRNDTGYAGELSIGLTVIDFTNKSNPQVIGNKTYANNFTHNTWLNDAGTVCFTTDEVGGGKVSAFDISNPSNIQELDFIRSNLSAGTAIPHNTHVLNDYLVTSYYRDGLIVFDGSRPGNLVQVADYDTSPLSGSGFDSDWGAYPFLPSGNALVSDMNNGLFILGIDYKRGCYLEGIVTDAVTTNPINGADIVIQTTSVSDLSNTAGEYAVGVVDSGSYTVVYSAYGYQDSTITVTLDNGVLVNKDIPLQPTPRVNFTLTVVEQGTTNPIANAEVQFNASGGAAQLPYTTDGAGQVNDTSFIEGSYDIIVGKWGYVTRELTNVTIDTSNNTLLVELTKGYYDDFALDFGWVISGNANAGSWERGEPVGTSIGGSQFNPELDLPGDISDECYVTGNGGGSAGADDVDGGVTILTSPSMDLATYIEPEVRFYRWFANGGGAGAPNDTLIVELNNGFTSKVITRIYGTNKNSWNQDAFIISNYIAPTSNMTIRFSCGDYGPGHVVEGAIDGFEVVDLGPQGVDNNLMNGEIFLVAAPNPAPGYTWIEFNSALTDPMAQLRFELRDITGKTVYSRDLDQLSGKFMVPMNVPSGMYFGTLIHKGVNLKSVKILVQD